jgi:hypothetical protein
VGEGSEESYSYSGRRPVLVLELELKLELKPKLEPKLAAEVEVEVEVEVASAPSTTTSDIICDGVRITVVEITSLGSAPTLFLKLNWAITPI